MNRVNPDAVAMLIFIIIAFSGAIDSPAFRGQRVQWHLRPDGQTKAGDTVSICSTAMVAPLRIYVFRFGAGINLHLHSWWFAAAKGSPLFRR